MYVILGRITVEVEGSVEGDQVEDARGDLHASEMTNMGLQLEEQQWALEFTLPQIARRHWMGRSSGIVHPGSDDLAHGGQGVGGSCATAANPSSPGARIQAMASVQAGGDAVDNRQEHPWKIQVRAVDRKSTRGPGGAAPPAIRLHCPIQVQGRQHLGQCRQYQGEDLHHKACHECTRSMKAQNLKPGSVAYPWEDVLGSAMAWLTLSALGAKLKENNWKKELRVLTPDNVRGRPQGTFSDPRHKQQNKKRKREADVQAEECRKEEERPASWIWMSQLSSAEDMEKGMMEALRIEWAKRQAGVAVDEGGDASRAPTCIDQCPVVVEDEAMCKGFTAYALSQSHGQRSLKSRFEGNWKDVTQYIELGQAGLEEIPEEDNSACSQKCPRI
ncbi:hypothetical protein C8R44DRAFT_753252 [Mycena epipterygia]|nr:hypothetical protein C8R44DRAFT_753252 [Mycena epipterygia]